MLAALRAADGRRARHERRTARRCGGSSGWCSSGVARAAALLPGAHRPDGRRRSAVDDLPALRDPAPRRRARPARAGVSSGSDYAPSPPTSSARSSPPRTPASPSTAASSGTRSRRPGRRNQQAAGARPSAHRTQQRCRGTKRGRSRRRARRSSAARRSRSSSPRTCSSAASAASPRKAQEFVITGFLEALLGKRRILEIYLNSVEWGEGVFGAEAAARHYFHVGAGQPFGSPGGAARGHAAGAQALREAPGLALRARPRRDRDGAHGRGRRSLTGAEAAPGALGSRLRSLESTDGRHPDRRDRRRRGAPRRRGRHGVRPGQAPRRARCSAGTCATRELPDNERLEDEVRAYIALFYADTQPRELAALRAVALDLDGAARRVPAAPDRCGLARHRDAAERHPHRALLRRLEAAELALIDRRIDYDVSTTDRPARRADRRPERRQPLRGSAKRCTVAPAGPRLRRPARRPQGRCPRTAAARRPRRRARAGTGRMSEPHLRARAAAGCGAGCLVAGIGGVAAAAGAALAWRRERPTRRSRRRLCGGCASHAPEAETSFSTTLPRQRRCCSTSGPPGARRASPRCRCWTASTPGIGPQGWTVVGLAVDREEPVRRFLAERSHCLSDRPGRRRGTRAGPRARQCRRRAALQRRLRRRRARCFRRKLGALDEPHALGRWAGQRSRRRSN